MRDYVRLAGILFIVCAIAAALLGFTNDITFDKIQEQIVRSNDEARKAVMSDADTFEQLDEAAFSKIKGNSKYSTVQEAYLAKSGGNVIGYAIKTAPKGYAGPVEVMVGISLEGSIQGIKVGNNTETPGLGKNAANPKFQDQFNAKKWDNAVGVIKSGTPKDNEIVAIAGATITSKAVALGVNQAMEAAKELSGK